MRYAEPYTLHKRVSPKGKTIWYYRLRGNRNAKSTGETVKWKAKRHVEELLEKPTHPAVTLGRFAAPFFTEECPWAKAQRAFGKSLSDAVIKMRRGHLENHILPEFKQRVMADVTAVDLRDWLVGLALANQTKNHIRFTMNILFAQARLEGIIQRSPLEDVPAFAGGSRHHDAFTLPELHALFPFKAAGLLEVWKYPKWAAMHYLMVSTGLRVGEACALLWQHVYLDRGALVVMHAVKASGRIGPPKNGTPRAASFPRRTRAVLAWWRAQSPYTEPTDFVFPGRDGETHLNTKTVGRIITSGAMEKAEIEVGGRKLSCHSLRVTYNTLMRPRLPEGVLQFMMGHRSRAMTERYDDASMEDKITTLLAPVRKQIEGAWG